MNFINRAFKNVTRKMSKTILLLLTFFLIGNLVIIGLGVSNAAENAKTLTRKKMRAVVNVSVDYDKVWRYIDSLEDQDKIDEFYKNFPSVKLSDVKELLKDERVSTANATSIYQFYAADGSNFDFSHLNNEYENRDQSDSTYCYYDDATGTQVCETYTEPIVSAKSNYFPSMIELEEGSFTITDGRFYTEEDINEGKLVAVITEELAETNGYGVGDHFTVSLVSPNEINHNGINVENTAVEFEIIGIYSHTNHINPDSNQFNWCSPYENPDNLILIPGSTYEIATLPYQQAMYDYWIEQYPEDAEYYLNNYPTLENIKNANLNDVVLLLNDPLSVEDFVKESIENVGEFVKVDANNEEFNRLAKPLDTLSLYANFIIWLVVINAIVIITLVTALTLKTREYEIGVLLSIGASKLKVIAQFFVELALVAVIGFTLAIGSGSLVASKVGEKVLDYQISESGVNEDDPYQWDDDYISVWDNDYSTDISLDDLVSEYNVSISPLIIGEIYVCGLAIVFVSIIIPSMMIMRFNPKKILMNQN